MKTINEMIEDFNALIEGSIFSKHKGKNTLEALNTIVGIQILKKFDEIEKALHIINDDIKEAVKTKYGIEI